jgi:hypothetical protein
VCLSLPNIAPFDVVESQKDPAAENVEKVTG